MINISIDSLNRLKNQSELKKLLTGEYLKDKTNENYQYIKNKFFRDETDEKAMLLTPGSQIIQTVIDTLSIYVGNPNLTFDFPTQELVEDYLTYNYATFALEKVNGKIVIQKLPSEDYYRENGTDNFLRIYTKRDENNNDILYYLVTSYSGSIITNTLYKLDKYGSRPDTVQSTEAALEQAEKVPLDTLIATENLEEKVISDLEKVFFIVRQSKLDSKLSLVEKLRGVTYELDRLEVLLNTEYLQHGKQYLLLNNIELPLDASKAYASGQNIDIDGLGKVVKGGDNSDIKFIQNENPFLKQVEDRRMVELEKVSSITAIPLDYLGASERVGSIGEDSRAMLHGNFIKRVQYIRDIFDKVIVQVIDIMQTGLGGKDISDIYNWESIIVKTDKQKSEELYLTYGKMSLISRKTALEIYLGVTSKEYQEEMVLQAEDHELSMKRLEDTVRIKDLLPKLELEKEKSKNKLILEDKDSENKIKEEKSKNKTEKKI